MKLSALDINLDCELVLCALTVILLIRTWREPERMVLIQDAMTLAELHDDSVLRDTSEETAHRILRRQYKKAKDEWLSTHRTTLND